MFVEFRWWFGKVPVTVVGFVEQMFVGYCQEDSWPLVVCNQEGGHMVGTAHGSLGDWQFVVCWNTL